MFSEPEIFLGVYNEDLTFLHFYASTIATPVKSITPDHVLMINRVLCFSIKRLVNSNP